MSIYRKLPSGVEYDVSHGSSISLEHTVLEMDEYDIECILQSITDVQYCVIAPELRDFWNSMAFSPCIIWKTK